MANKMSSKYLGPPMFKATMVHLNKDIDGEGNSYEILTNEYNKKDTPGASTNSITETKKKRRRTSASIGSEEFTRRKSETKQSHSIIEKKRRVKLNREFEALKYLIPACRATGPASTQNSKGAAASKIDGMHKLTILKSSVEYILYLHHMIRMQHEMLKNKDGYDFDIGFAEIDLDVNDYRNIEKDFEFSELYSQEGNFNTNSSTSGSASSDSMKSKNKFSSPDCTPSQAVDKADDLLSDSGTQLPSPEQTPDMQPFSLSDYRKANRPYKKSVQSCSTSPFTTAHSSTILSNFILPDPAYVVSDNQDGKLFVKPKTASNVTGPSSKPSEFKLSERDASDTLLSLRKSSINNLLN